MPNQAPKGTERKKTERDSRALGCSCCPPPEHLHPLSPSLPSSLCGHFSTARFQNNLVLETERRQERDNLKSFLPAEHSLWHMSHATSLSVLPQGSSSCVSKESRLLPPHCPVKPWAPAHSPGQIPCPLILDRCHSLGTVFS